MRVEELLACALLAISVAGCGDETGSASQGGLDGGLPEASESGQDSAASDAGDGALPDGTIADAAKDGPIGDAAVVDGATGEYLPGDEMEPWEGGPSYYAKWPKGPSTDPNVFPIAVWLQQPKNLEAFRGVGINLFIGLWEGPTEEQLATLATGNMPVFCDQNQVGLTGANAGVIRSWAHQDEPDNAQNGTQDPVPTGDIITGYEAMVAQDATRPVYLNLGQGVATDLWFGRGNRTGHPEDYAEYAKGADIVSFDVYPMNVFPYTGDPNATWFKDYYDAVAQNLWYVAEGVKRLREWTGNAKPVWTWLESTNIEGNSQYALTPVHVKAEVWMALVHGARGIGYFSHQFSPFSETGLLDDAQMAAGVKAINAQVAELAPVLNTQTVKNGVTTSSSNAAVPVSAMVKRAGGYTYVFAVGMRPGDTTATFTLRGFAGDATVEVLGESRTAPAKDGVFEDGFAGHAVHLYKVATP